MVRVMDQDLGDQGLNSHLNIELIGYDLGPLSLTYLTRLLLGLIESGVSHHDILGGKSGI